MTTLFSILARLTFMSALTTIEPWILKEFHTLSVWTKKRRKVKKKAGKESKKEKKAAKRLKRRARNARRAPNESGAAHGDASSTTT